MPDLTHIAEPPLLFAHAQSMCDPRDGLSLFGPIDVAKPEGIRWGLIGPKDAMDRMIRWVDSIQRPVISGETEHDRIARPLFPGFEAVFHAKWKPTPDICVEVSDDTLWDRVRISDSHQRVYRAVGLYAEQILDSLRNEDVTPYVWVVIVPDYVYQYCRPHSAVPAELQVRAERTLKPNEARDLYNVPSFAFMEDQAVLAEEYMYEVNFHNQLKARLLDKMIPTQIVRESTIAPEDVKNAAGEPLRSLVGQESAIAWTLSTAMFYKAGGRPWKLASVRKGVCYLGLVFKQDVRACDSRTACCAAQMFLDSGDGVVFKGAVGPWYREKRGEYHLSRRAAREVVGMCVRAYADKSNGQPPSELFIHGRVAFGDEEWAGFREAAGRDTIVTGVRIRSSDSLKLFRQGRHPVLRGTAYVANARQAYLWSRGLTPRLRTYPGREVPNPLLVEVCRGDADIAVVLRDVLALTKLNYNSCVFGDGPPVTLRFADDVGEILTAGPKSKMRIPPLAFKYYI